jgi:protein-tyrosine-phosphatase/DNA-binding transcriptional ArsR family regulator
MDLEHRARVHAALGDPQRLTIADALTISDLTVTEIGTMVDMPSNLLAHHLDVLEDAGVVRRKASEGDRRRRYVVLNPAIAGLITHGSPAVEMTPLFVCTHNAARSQFAAALWGDRTGEPVHSAGTEPADRVHPLAVAAAAEHGVDLTHAKPRSYGDIIDPPDIVITVCDRAGEAGPPFPAPRLHWSIPDPVPSGDIVVFRSSFRDIAERIDRLLVEQA